MSHGYSRFIPAGKTSSGTKFCFHRSCFMEAVSRRGVIGIAAGVAACGVLASEAVLRGDSTEEKPKPEADEPAVARAESAYKFRMGTAPARRYGESSVREHKLHDFPISASMAASLINLAAGTSANPTGTRILTSGCL
jgi:hypothetical protein